MNNLSEVMPAQPAFSKGALLQRLFKICYLTAIIISMTGWVSAFGWLAVKVVQWILA
jgi:hypothetical protein